MDGALRNPIGRRLRPAWFLLALVLAWHQAAFAAATQSLEANPSERRIALVIGNSAYSTGPLKNPLNDARAMAAALKDLGFEVLVRENAGMGTMVDAIREFSRKAQDAQVRLFYYAGHGVQVKGRNYLVPVDAAVQSEDEIPSKTTDASELLDRLGQMKSGLNIVILDACRNNPFANTNMVLADGRVVKFRGAAPSGLAHMDAPQGTLVAFATGPNSVAMDGANMRNSLYTKYLLEYIGVPGLPVEQLFKRVRVSVAQETKRMQVPWESSSLMGDFCFRAAPGGACAMSEIGRIAPAQFNSR